MNHRLSTWTGRGVLVFLYVPIAAVVVYSLNASDVSYRWDGVGLDWYRVLLADTALLESLRTSLVVGVLSASLATAVGLPAALGLARPDLPGRRALLGAMAVPLLVPEIVLGVALLSLFSQLDVATGLTTLVLGHVVITLPMATLVMLGAATSLDPGLSDAAADLGCTPLRTFTRVLLPLLAPAVGAAWLLAFTTSFGNIVMSTFTNGVGSTTLPLRVYSLLKTGITPEINALGTVLVLATAVLLTLVGAGQVRRTLGMAAAE